MCSGIALILGLVLLGKGDFRFMNRYVPKEQGRLIGAILATPFFLGICAGFLLLPAAMNTSGDLTVEALVSSPQYNTIAMLELGSLVVAIGLVLYLILSRPPTPPGYTPPQQATRPPTSPSNTYPFGIGSMPPTPPAAPPSIMTVSEAAAYLRVTESEVEQLINEGKIAAARTASGYRIARSVIDDYVQNQS